MLKKLFFLIIIFVISYWILIFKFPELADKIEVMFWVSINEKLRSTKESINNFSTSLPEKADIVETYKPIVDEAREVTNQVIERANDVKNKVDDVRVTLSWAEETLNKAKETIDEINKIWNDVKNLISSWSTN